MNILIVGRVAEFLLLLVLTLKSTLVLFCSLHVITPLGPGTDPRFQGMINYTLKTI